MGVSSYIAELRRFVGHALILLPAVAVLPFDAEGRLLLVRHSDDGLWATVGGAVDPDESPQEAALREAAEETGLVLELGELRGVLGGPRYRARYANGDECSYVPIVFEASVVGGEGRPDGDEVLELGWFELARLPVPEMSDFTRFLLGEIGLLQGA